MTVMMTRMMMMMHLPKTLPSLITSYSPSAETYKWEPSSPDYHHDYLDNHYHFYEAFDDCVKRITLDIQVMIMMVFIIIVTYVY